MTDQTQTTTEPVLLPCPFCGGEPDRLAAMGESWVRCMTCNAATEMFGTDTAAIAAWNRRPALSPPAEVPFAAEDACLACNSPTPVPVDHIGDATEKVDWARCQRCGGEIQGWICQDCHQEFEENDASELVFCPSESVDWERVGPKLVEALKVEREWHDLRADFACDEARECSFRHETADEARAMKAFNMHHERVLAIDAALAAAQPEKK